MEAVTSFLVALAANVLAGLFMRGIERRKPRKQAGKHARRG